MKRLMVMAMIAVGAGTLTGCVDAPGKWWWCAHSGFYYSDPGYYGGATIIAIADITARRDMLTANAAGRRPITTGMAAGIAGTGGKPLRQRTDRPEKPERFTRKRPESSVAPRSSRTGSRRGSTSRASSSWRYGPKARPDHRRRGPAGTSMMATEQLRKSKARRMPGAVDTLDMAALAVFRFV